MNPFLRKRRDESELKSSEDKMITGREKSGEVEGLLDEKDVAEDQDLNAGAYAAAESTIVDSIAAPQPTTATVTSSELVTGQAITKEELNFRQVQLTEEEQKTVNELKITGAILWIRLIKLRNSSILSVIVANLIQNLNQNFLFISL